jgi:type I restriction enzyme S subunit
VVLERGSGWETIPLAEAAFVGAGNSAPQKKEFFEDGRYPFIRTSDVGQIGFGEISEARDLLNDAGVAKLRRVPKGAILMPKSGASTFLNHRVETTIDAYISSHLATIEARKDRAVPRYLLYYLSTVRAQNLIQDHKYPSLTLGQIGSIPVPLPPLEEQKRIVEVLDQAFAALTRARAHAEANLADARALPEAAIDEIFLSKHDGWTDSTLGEVCDFIGGSQPPKSAFVLSAEPGTVRLIQIRDYKSDSKAVYIPIELARRFCEPDDVMIGRYGPPLFQILRGIKGAYNVALMKAKPREKVLSKDFLYYFLKNREILRYIIESSSRAAGQAGVNKATLEPYPISFPSLDEQRNVVERLEGIWGQSQTVKLNCEKKLRQISNLRQSLLHRAFSGQLTA